MCNVLYCLSWGISVYDKVVQCDIILEIVCFVSACKEIHIY